MLSTQRHTELPPMPSVHKPLMIFLLASALNACGGYTVKQLETDHQLRRKIIAECLLMGPEAREVDKCVVAAKAQVKATGQKVLNLLDD